VEENVRYSNEVRQSLRASMTTLSLGPTLRYDFGRIASTITGGWAVNFLDWRARYSEALSYSVSPDLALVGFTGPFYLGAWNRRNNGQKIVSGAFLQGALEYEVTSRWSLSAFGRYDWDQPLNEHTGLGSFHIDLSGFAVGGSISLNF
jgi:hypothetical protein